jgi:hypothetical protein
MNLPIAHWAPAATPTVTVTRRCDYRFEPDECHVRQRVQSKGRLAAEDRGSLFQLEYGLL